MEPTRLSASTRSKATARRHRHFASLWFAWRYRFLRSWPPDFSRAGSASKPKRRWRANYGCFIRMHLSSFFVALGLELESNALIPDLGLSLCTMLCSAFATACVYVAMMIGVAALWASPTPFAIVVSAVPFALTTVMFLLLAVGPSRLAKRSSLRNQVVRRMYMGVAQAMLVLVYPTFSAVYYWLPSGNDFLFVFLLPIIKLTMQHIVAWTSRDLEEYTPGNVVFCVGVFNSLYMSKCMQRSGSCMAYAVVMALDVINSITAYRRLHKTVTRILALLQACDRRSLLDQSLIDAVVKIVKLPREPGVLHERHLSSGICIRSPIITQLSQRGTLLLNELTVSQLQQTAESPTRSNVAALIRILRGSMRILPNASEKNGKVAMIKTASKASTRHETHLCLPNRVQPLPRAIEPSAQAHSFSIVPSARKPSDGGSDPSLASKQEIIRMCLKLLFECEYYVLVEYVESVIPMMYAMYVLIVGQLSSAEYYPDTHGKSPTQIEFMVLNIAAYAMTEVLSFIGMELCVKWKSSLSPVYLLAFVIENQAQVFLGQLFVWYVVLLQLTLTHFGTFSSIQGLAFSSFS